MFFYYQMHGGQDTWLHDLYDLRDKVIEKKAPRYVSALALSRPIESATPEEIEAVKYLGPFYADFDVPKDAVQDPAEGIRLVTKQFNLFLDRLAEEDVDLSTLRLFATGGRGFHLEMPIETLIAKAPKDGMVGLPHIFKEVAYSLYVNTLDLRVYSGKRGRMWRTPNVQRENGAYKVRITVEEARDMTPELYAKLCSAPREEIHPSAYSAVKSNPQYVSVPAPAKMSMGMARLFAEALIKVGDAFKRRRKGGAQAEVLARFKGEFPPTVAAILGNQNLRDDAGWNQIAMQVAIVANGVGKTHDEVIAAARDLIEGHKGSGGRYGTPAAREEQLRAQLVYTQDNPCYTYLPAAIKVLLDDSVAAVDLDGVTDQEVAKDIANAIRERAGDPEASEDDDLMERGIVIGPTGIRQKVDKEWQQWCNVGFDRVSLLTRADTGKPLAMEADMYFKGELKGRVAMPLDIFLSRQRFHAFISSETAASFQGTDNTVQAIQEALHAKARAFAREHSMELVVRREGLDFIQIPANVKVPDVAREPFPVWASPDGCLVPKRIREAGISFSYLGDPMPQGTHRTDLMSAPPLEDSPRLRAVLHALFHMNRPRTVGPMLGWLVACHARQMYQHYKSAFPLLGVAGESGSGKTTTLRALGKLHFYKRGMPDVNTFGSTQYGVENSILSSASVPSQLGEYKPREFADKAPRIRGLFRSAYDNQAIVKGGGAQIALSSGKEVTERTLSGPIAYLGVQLETETEIVERTVQVVCDLGGQLGRGKHLALVQREGEVFASVGRQVVLKLLSLPYVTFCDTFDREYEVAYERMFSGRNSRIVFNYAVVLHGLRILQDVLEEVGVSMPEEFEMMRDAVMLGPLSLGGDDIEVADGKGGSRMETKSEMAKTLSVFATMSLMGSALDGTKLLRGTDYDFGMAGDQEVLEINVPFTFAKYEEWCGRHRKKPYFDSEESFRFALRSFVAYLDSTPGELGKFEGVVRLRVDDLLRAQVYGFKRN
jgi:hypothetical protein